MVRYIYTYIKRKAKIVLKKETINEINYDYDIITYAIHKKVIVHKREDMDVQIKYNIFVHICDVNNLVAFYTSSHKGHHRLLNLIWRNPFHDPWIHNDI